MNLTTDSVLVRDTTLAAADLDGGVVVLSMHAGAYVSFNGVASEIWRLLSEPRRVGEIFDALLKSHDVDAATVSHDVLPFLQRLVESKLARQVRRESAE